MFAPPPECTQCGLNHHGMCAPQVAQSQHDIINQMNLPPPKAKGPELTADQEAKHSVSQRTRDGTAATPARRGRLRHTGCTASPAWSG